MTGIVANPNLHEVVITAIVYDHDKFLIIRRSPTKKRFPGMWTVPGGRLETSDYTTQPRDTEAYWYNVLEKTLRREVQEEVGLRVDKVEYLTSLATIHPDGSPSIVISCIARFAGGEVRLQQEEADQFAWVTVEEAKNYPLVDGIYDELVMVRKKLAGEEVEWQKITKA